MPLLAFTVDSQLLEELGRRLVGRPYIALAELVKNSYDANATEVTIELDPKAGSIVVKDNGHGMNFVQFRNFWMRVGSRHKEQQRFSESLRKFKRPLTGSKGIGRLAVQYLAREVRISTTSEKDSAKRIEAHIDWKKAVSAGDLTNATAEYKTRTSRKGFAVETRIELTRLRQKWDQKAVEGLAREIWWLRAPFRRQSNSLKKTALDFEIKFISPQPEFVRTFEEQMDAILDIWKARLVGKNVRGNVTLSLEFKGKDPITHSYTIPLPCRLDGGDFEIRIYKLRKKQAHGIKVQDARDYLNEHGGVHVYDVGFHLPYYGTPQNDWLKIEFDHSHRLSKSVLLPDDLQVTRGMSFLPTLSRILGVVNVDTSHEKTLKIAITRDRLQEETAFGNLIWMVRYAMDFYAVKEAINAQESEAASKETETLKFQRLEDALDKYRERIPKNTYEELRTDIHQASVEIESKAELIAARVGLIGPLATAGITSLAYQHELKQQFTAFNEIVDKVGVIRAQLGDQKVAKSLDELRDDLRSWMKRAELTNALFAYFGEAENLQNRKRFPAEKVVEEIWTQMEFLARGATVSTGRLQRDLMLPKASLVEWSSIFQNVFLNAFNAMVRASTKQIDVCSISKGREHQILVQDTGVGVELTDAESLFKPFVRKMDLSPERRAMGYGGTGLGLTIVRLVAQNIGVSVSFVKPQKHFRTAFSVSWREEG
jgi:signal transduction histidine kinase